MKGRLQRQFGEIRVHKKETCVLIINFEHDLQRLTTIKTNNSCTIQCT